MADANWYRNLPLDEYLSRDWWTRSKLDDAKSDPAGCYERHISKTAKPRPKGEALAIGAEVDAQVCGEESPCVRLGNAKSFRTTAYKGAQEEQPGQLFLSIEGAETADLCAAALLANKWWKETVGGASHVHYQPTFSRECAVTGLTLAARPDLVVGNYCIDVKTASGPNAGSKDSFREWWWWEVARRGYHRQAAMQIDGLRAVTRHRYTHVLAVIEKPRDGHGARVRYYTLPEAGTAWSLETGRAEVLDRSRRVEELLSISPDQPWIEPETLSPVALVRDTTPTLTVGGTPMEGI